MANENEDTETGHCAVTDASEPTLDQLFAELVTAEQEIDGRDAVRRVLRYARAVRPVDEMIATLTAQHKAELAEARALRKAAKGKAAKEAITLPTKPDAINGTVRQIYARHGANYVMAQKARTRIAKTIKRHFKKGTCTLGLTAIDLVYECAQRLRSNLKKGAVITDSATIEAAVDAEIPRLIEDLEAGMPIAAARSKHKQGPVTRGTRYDWTDTGWIPARVELAAEPKRKRKAKSTTRIVAVAAPVDADDDAMAEISRSLTGPKVRAPEVDDVDPDNLDDDEIDEDFKRHMEVAHSRQRAFLRMTRQVVEGA